MILEEHLETTVKAHDQQLHRRVDLLLRTGKLLVESLAETYGCLSWYPRREASHQRQFYHVDGECE